MGNCHDKKSQRTFVDPQSLHPTDIDRLERGIPIFVNNGLNVTRNINSNKLEGVPVEWAKKYKLPMEVDMNKTVVTNHLPKQIRPSNQLPKSINDFIENKQSKFGVTSSKFSMISSGKRENLYIDRSSKYGIKNLTSELIEQIQISEMSSDISEPEQLIELISLQDQPLYVSKKEHKLLTTDEFHKYLSKLRIEEKNPAEVYNFTEQIGKGSMCKVYAATSKLNTNIKYAVKIIKLDEERTLQKVKNEIAAMEMCYSENIIDYSFTFIFKDTLFIFMEFMTYGSLTSFINDYKCKIPEAVIAYIVFEILKGLNCIHSRWQIHRDIKSDNILISKDGEVKISDFGYALQFTKEKTSCRDVVGTPAWMAPELIMKKQYNESVDIWSLGVIITELINGEPRYLRFKPLKAMYMIVSEEPPTLNDSVSFELRVFVQKCLQKDPTKRATIKELLNDPFIKNVMSFNDARKTFKEMLERSKRK